MGFSDSFKKISGLGLLEKQFGSLSRPLSKSSGGFSKRAKEGKMKGGDFFSAFLGGPLGTQENANKMLDVFRNPNKETIRASLSSHFKTTKGQILGANLGHQLIAPLFDVEDAPDAPLVKDKPAQGATTIAAKRQARQRALNAAAQRRGLGLSGTVRTTPLGLQGDGAAVSRRRLIGE